ncbi:hypothetical protein EDD15DRAFT_868149 [Pisolithus albus]|nr:hypothetical protein EDD15DRAFT_868149 [Pisolithus albus]
MLSMLIGTQLRPTYKLGSGDTGTLTSAKKRCNCFLFLQAILRFLSTPWLGLLRDDTSVFPQAHHAPRLRTEDGFARTHQIVRSVDVSSASPPFWSSGFYKLHSVYSRLDGEPGKFHHLHLNTSVSTLRTVYDACRTRPPCCPPGKEFTLHTKGNALVIENWSHHPMPVGMGGVRISTLANKPYIHSHYRYHWSLTNPTCVTG